MYWPTLRPFARGKTDVAGREGDPFGAVRALMPLSAKAAVVGLHAAITIGLAWLLARVLLRREGAEAGDVQNDRREHEHDRENSG